MPLIKWNTVLDAYKKQNPKGFDYLGNFHRIYGLEDANLSHYERIHQIGEFMGCDFDQILEDLEASAASCIHVSCVRHLEIEEDGVFISS